MSFETKYLIRWGIPGWTFITLLSLLMILNDVSFSVDIESTTNLLSITGVLTVLGVPLGYLFHQIYFAFSWVFLGNFKDVTKETTEHFSNEIKKIFSGDYFKVEMAWHAILLDIEETEKRDYIVDRYRHLLSNVHSLGVLSLVFIIFNILTIVMLLINSNYQNLIFLLVGLLLNVSSMINYRYYSKNKNFFMGNIMAHYLIEYEEREAERKKNE
ncbi:hypothetical protein MKX54_15405 [Alkalihalobacillus sp. FSL R5-0424]